MFDIKIHYVSWNFQLASKGYHYIHRCHPNSIQFYYINYGYFVGIVCVGNCRNIF